MRSASINVLAYASGAFLGGIAGTVIPNDSRIIPCAVTFTIVIWALVLRTIYW